MPNYTPNLNLKKPLQEEFYNVDVFNENADKIDAEMAKKANITHKHDGSKGNSSKITATEIAAGAADDAAIGNRTITDTTALAGTATTLTTILGRIGNMIKSITGKPNWYTAPATSLQAIYDLITSTATANKLLKLDANGKLPADITGNADTVDGKHASDFVQNDLKAFTTSPTITNTQTKLLNGLSNTANIGVGYNILPIWNNKTNADSLIGNFYGIGAGARTDAGDFCTSLFANGAEVLRFNQSGTAYRVKPDGSIVQYATVENNVASASKVLDATVAGYAFTFNWQGKSGQPAYVLGGENRVIYAYDPGNFDVAKVGGYTAQQLMTSGNISILTGKVAHGGTLPLPSGYTEGQCKWMVSTSSHTVDDDDTIQCYTSAAVLNTANAGRVVTCYTAQRGGGTANYMIIGVK